MAWRFERTGAVEVISAAQIAAREVNEDGDTEDS